MHKQLLALSVLLSIAGPVAAQQAVSTSTPLTTHSTSAPKLGSSDSADQTSTDKLTDDSLRKITETDGLTPAEIKTEQREKALFEQLLSPLGLTVLGGLSAAAVAFYVLKTKKQVAA